jgi:hypothetical protein
VSASRWAGTAWTAAVEEARAHLARAEGRTDDYAAFLGRAASLFETAGQSRDADRCREAARSNLATEAKVAAPVR